MASKYTMVAYGSQGGAVKQLQSELNKRGYQLDEDGIYGKKTKAAVRDYQKKNSLKRDGIAGDETWGSLMSASASAAEEPQASVPKAAPTARTAKALAELEAGYKPSDSVKEALAHRDSVASQRPGDYESLYEQQLAQLYEELTGRAPFSYDPEADGGFQQYTQLYTQRGRAAMEDTMGQAAALTGGYGSSYAQGAGQQAYNGYLQELAALVPELRQAALAEYQQEGKALQNQYSMLDAQEKADYDRWQEARGDWQKQLEAAQAAYEDAGSQDQKLYQTLLAHFSDKAEQERKLSASGVRLTDSGDTGSRGESLSSTAAESLQRAVGNYLKRGNGDLAQALAAQYTARMTPAQRQRFEKLLGQYGMTLA